MPSANELLIVLIIALLIFGGAKIPKLARSLGQAQKEFKTGMTEGAAEADKASGEPAPSAGSDKPGGSSAKNGSA